MSSLSPERWRALSPYLDEGLDMTAEGRDAWLASLSERDAALGADLKQLLAEHENLQDARFLEGSLPPIVDADATHLLKGQILGAYRLDSLIGEGGMGSVWLAERCDGRYEGRAAVKLLNIALIGRAGEERFRREGSFLAKVTHPHIARLIDAGVSPVGQPYLVLEHVDGHAIDQYCNAQTLGIEARVTLFLDVLAAVAHAHANLIVHRDIKPANVLVSVDGQVKLLDFGIAKLIDGDTSWGGSRRAEMTPLTREGGAALTPEYAAPEQLTNHPVTTATDVYALGVLLYMLLSGRHPAGEAVNSPVTLIRAIVDIEPRRLSDAVVSRAVPDALAVHAANCGVTPARLRRVLRGDLDTIVGKALKKNAAERYPSVTAFADDLRRCLRHEPISARPDTLRYRASRFVKRHARGVAAAAVILLMLAGFTFRLATERDRAQREAAKAAKVSEALTGLLMGVDPIENRATSEALTVQRLLDNGADRVKSELAGQPDAQAEILTVMGRMYRRMGVYDRAQHLLEQALISGRAAFGPEHQSVAETLNTLGGVAAEKGDYATAAASFEASLNIRRKIYGPTHREVANTLAELGRVYQDNGFNGRAEPLQRAALAIRQELLGHEHAETAVSLGDVASVLRLNGDLDGAAALLRQSLDLSRKLRGEEHAITATTMHDVAVVAASKGDLASAEAQFRKAIDIHRKALRDNHPLVAVTLNSLSRVLRDQGRYAEAANALDTALQIARPALGSEHQLVAIYTINLAAIHLKRNQPQAAEPLLREGLRVRALAPQLVPNRRRIFPEDDWSIGETKSLLGESLTALGRYSEAETVLVDACRELEERSPAARRDLEAAIGRLIKLYEASGKPDKVAVYKALLVPTSRE